MLHTTSTQNQEVDVNRTPYMKFLFMVDNFLFLRLHSRKYYVKV